MTCQQVIDKYYPVGSRLRDIYLLHCRSVARKALEIKRDKNLDLDEKQIITAAMFHDIGIFMTDAPDIDCHGNLPYIQHGIAGAHLLKTEGFDDIYVNVAKNHTGAGIAKEDISAMNIPLPEDDYMPTTLLERLICYADKFYSKSGDMKEKPLERVRLSMKKISNNTLDRFEKLHEEFG